MLLCCKQKTIENTMFVCDTFQKVKVTLPFYFFEDKKILFCEPALASAAVARVPLSSVCRCLAAQGLSASADKFEWPKLSRRKILQGVCCSRWSVSTFAHDFLPLFMTREEVTMGEIRLNFPMKFQIYHFLFIGDRVISKVKVDFDKLFWFDVSLLYFTWDELGIIFREWQRTFAFIHIVHL